MGDWVVGCSTAASRAPIAARFDTDLGSPSRLGSWSRPTQDPDHLQTKGHRGKSLRSRGSHSGQPVASAGGLGALWGPGTKRRPPVDPTLLDQPNQPNLPPPPLGLQRLPDPHYSEKTTPRIDGSDPDHPYLPRPRYRGLPGRVSTLGGLGLSHALSGAPRPFSSKGTRGGEEMGPQITETPVAPTDLSDFVRLPL